jgi:hypothetical protein
MNAQMFDHLQSNRSAFCAVPGPPCSEWSGRIRTSVDPTRLNIPVSRQCAAPSP